MHQMISIVVCFIFIIIVTVTVFVYRSVKHCMQLVLFFLRFDPSFILIITPLPFSLCYVVPVIVHFSNALTSKPFKHLQSSPSCPMILKKTPSPSFFKPPSVSISFSILLNPRGYFKTEQQAGGGKKQNCLQKRMHLSRRNASVLHFHQYKYITVFNVIYQRH